MTDKQKKKEVGYVVEDVENRPAKNEFAVEIRFPELERENAKYSFAKGEGWRDEIEYYDNGEIKKAPRWKTHIERHLRKNYKGEIENQDDDLSDVKKYKGEKLDV